MVVATPIGNLADLSSRARSELQSADLVACEDTRRTGRLLAAHDISATRLLRLDEHMERRRAGEIVEEVRAGARVALVSDAGTPVVADPGRLVVDAVLDAGLRVETVPGPSAVVAALVVSGFAAERFVFEGFLPRRGDRRRHRIEEVAAEQRTVLLYEAPTRLAATLADLREACGDDRRVAICRELTKLHEEVWRGPILEAVARVDEKPPRGEHVVVVEGAAPPAPPDEAAIRRALASARAQGASTRDSVDMVRRELGVGRREVYRVALDESASGDHPLDPR